MGCERERARERTEHHERTEFDDMALASVALSVAGGALVLDVVVSVHRMQKSGTFRRRWVGKRV